MDKNNENRLKEQLRNKYKDNPNEFASALEGLLHHKGVYYWEYIQLTQLQNLQHPLTSFPDEVIFIAYHQICELYFKLILQELKILTSIENKEFLDENNWLKRIGRCINYYQKLTDSIDIMQPGTKGESDQFFSTEEFSKFRLALSPASGFQTVSVREIELYSTSLTNLCHSVEEEKKSDLRFLYNNIYWKSGSLMTDSAGQKLKTKTLHTFEEKYDSYLFELAQNMQFRNIEYLFCHYNPAKTDEKKILQNIRKNPKIIELLKHWDHQVNKEWKIKHLMVIRQHLKEDNYGTGGTNWKEYLPPKFQNIRFFPEIR